MLWIQLKKNTMKPNVVFTLTMLWKGPRPRPPDHVPFWSRIKIGTFNLFQWNRATVVKPPASYGNQGPVSLHPAAELGGPPVTSSARNVEKPGEAHRTKVIQ